MTMTTIIALLGSSSAALATESEIIEDVEFTETEQETIEETIKETEEIVEELEEIIDEVDSADESDSEEPEDDEELEEDNDEDEDETNEDKAERIAALTSALEKIEENKNNNGAASTVLQALIDGNKPSEALKEFHAEAKEQRLAEKATRAEQRDQKLEDLIAKKTSKNKEDKPSNSNKPK